VNELLTQHNGTFTHSRVGAVHYNDERFTGRAKSRPKRVRVASLPQSYQNELYQKLWLSLTKLLH